jgi:DNA polymerase III subunit beta
MEIKIDTKSLAITLGGMLAIVEKTSVKPILNNVLLSATKGILTLSASDSSTYASKDLKAHIKKEGSTTTSARMLHDIVRKISDEEIVLHYLEQNEQLQIRGNNCEFTLATLPSSQFPSVENFSSTVEFEVLTADFIKILENTVFSTSTEETRYNLNGVFLHVTSESEFLLRAASTDCHRLSFSSAKMKQACKSFEIILPKKTTEEFIRLAKNTNSENLKVELSDRLIKVKNENTVIVSKLVDGKFPEYKSLIPNKNTNLLRIDSQYFEEIISRVSTITTGAIEKLRTVEIKINTQQMTVSAHGNAYAFANETVKFLGKEHPHYTGCELIIGFNPRYLLDVLKSVGKTEIDLLLGTPLSPILIRTKNDENTSFVVMPIKISSNNTQVG